MIATLILTQGHLADELLQSARVIVGETPAAEALAVDWDSTPEAIAAEVRDAIARLDEGDGVLILTDLQGSSPDNAARLLATEQRVAVLAGVNLPMVVRLACPRPPDMSLEQLASWTEEKGRRSISGGVVEGICGPAGERTT